MHLPTLNLHVQNSKKSRREGFNPLTPVSYEAENKRAATKSVQGAGPDSAHALAAAHC